MRNNLRQNERGNRIAFSSLFSFLQLHVLCCCCLSAPPVCAINLLQKANTNQASNTKAIAIFVLFFFSFARQLLQLNTHKFTSGDKMLCSALAVRRGAKREETVGGQLTSLILANCERCSLLSVWHHRQLPLTRNDTNSESVNETEMCKWAQRAYLKQHSEEGGRTERRILVPCRAGPVC